MLRLLTLAIAAAALSAALLQPGRASADEDWVIDSFEVEYTIDESGIVQVVEDIRVDFGTLERHGIFRDMPVLYDYDGDNNRRISVGNVQVDDGTGAPHEFTLSSSDANLRIRIGDPDVLITSEQRYRISYVLTAALNPFDDHDEFFWNVTGLDWPVPIQSASAVVRVPDGGVEQVTCFEGPGGSTDPCVIPTFDSEEASFEASAPLGSHENLTIVVGLEKGAVEVSPPVLEPKNPDVVQEVIDFVADEWYVFPMAAGVLIAGMVILFRLWWVNGRDHWLGDMFYLSEGDPTAVTTRKPPFAGETIVVEFAPPEADKRSRRPLRPAEIGLLMDESADTLDVTATIVDLAVRKHLKIAEIKSGGILGLFKSTDYELTRLDTPDDDLLPYEKKLRNSLFGGKQTVELSSLAKKFHTKLEKVQEALYRQSVQDKLFPRDPNAVRTGYTIAGAVTIVVGGGLFWLLGSGFGGALIGAAVVVLGLLVLLFARAMPSRTARGRTLYRRSLGFRRFMTESDRERQRFAERANIFHEYLPYAIVFGCVDKWAKAFEELGIDPGEPDYYVGTRAFAAGSFISSMNSFSSSVSGTIASTPGGSGGSGFSGGGSSGGGGGGGGGGSW